MFDPAPGYIAVKPLKQEETLGSGLKLPPSMTDKDANIGEILAIGDVRKNETGELEWLGGKLEIGQIVAYRPFSDIIVEIQLQKVSYVAYDQIVATKKGV